MARSLRGGNLWPDVGVEATPVQDTDAVIENPEVSCIPVDSSSSVVNVTLGEDLAYHEHVVKVVDVGQNAGTNAIQVEASAGPISGDVGVTLTSDATAAEFVYLEPPGEWFVTNTFNPAMADSGDGGLVGGLL